MLVAIGGLLVSVPSTLQESLGFGLLVGRFIDLINRAETIIC